MAFNFVRTITIDHTKVAANESDYVLLVKGVYPFLKTVANGGSVANANGYDIVFAFNAAGTDRCAWETVRWNANTGDVEYHVRVGTVSSTVDTIVYLCYGDASITADQSDRPGTWPATFVLVHHYPDGDSLTTIDSTVNANDGAVIGGGVSATAGQIDGAAGFSSSVDGLIQVPTAASLNNLDSAPMTLSFWVFLNGVPLNWAAPLNKSDGDVTKGWLLLFPNNNIDFHIVHSVFDTNWIAFPQPNISQWSHIVVTYNGVENATGAKLYVNGALVAWTAFQLGSGTHDSDATEPLQIGATSAKGFFSDPARVNELKLGGTMDEVRVETVELSASNILTRYNNQSSPETFYSIDESGGCTITITGPPPPPPPPEFCEIVPAGNSPELIIYNEPLERTGS